MRLELHVRDVGITVETGQQIWETARKLVQTEGMEVTHPRLRADLAGKPGLDVSGDRVRIAPDLFEEHYPSPETKRARLQANPPPPPDTKPRPFRLSCGGYSMDVVDWHTGAIRPATVRDLIESVRLAEAFDSSGPYCVTPQDVPPFLQDIATYKTCFEHAKTIRGYYYSSPVQAPFIEQMCAVMGEQFDVILGVVSPLKMSNSDLDNLYRTIDEGKTYPVRLVGYGVPGIATPAKLAASSALVMAENYAAVLLLELALPEHSIGRPGAHGGGATDFRHCCYALGAPHTFAYNLINLYIMHAIEAKTPRRSSRCATRACTPAPASRMSRPLPRNPRSLFSAR